MEALGTVMLVFGAIFLVIPIVSALTMKTKVENPNCPEEVKSVEYNKKWAKIYLILYSAITAVGGLILLFA